MHDLHLRTVKLELRMFGFSCSEVNASLNFRYEHATLLAPVLCSELVVELIIANFIFHYEWRLFSIIACIVVALSILILLAKRFSEVRKLTKY
jgi:drug/metabolite transporter (DMT)-like permease